MFHDSVCAVKGIGEGHSVVALGLSGHGELKEELAFGLTGEVEAPYQLGIIPLDGVVINSYPRGSTQRYAGLSGVVLFRNRIDHIFFFATCLDEVNSRCPALATVSDSSRDYSAWRRLAL